MPELPEVEEARRLLARNAVGRRIAAVGCREDRLVFDGLSPREVRRRLEGRKVLAARRWGKQLWLTPLSPNRLRLGERGWKPRRRRAHGRRTSTGGPAAVACSPSPHSTQRGIAAVSRQPIMRVNGTSAVDRGRGAWRACHRRTRSSRLVASYPSSRKRLLTMDCKRVVRTALTARADPRRYPRRWLFHRRWDSKSTESPAGDRLARTTIAGRTTVWVPAVQG